MKSPETVFNVWFTFDIRTQLYHSWRMKPYSLNGTDKEISEKLKILSESDYVTTAERKFPKTFIANFVGIKISGAVGSDNIDFVFDTFSDYFYTEIEKELPKIKQLVNGEFILVSQKISDTPYFVRTILAHNEFGETRPLCNPENHKWCDDEMRRLDYV